MYSRSTDTVKQQSFYCEVQAEGFLKIVFSVVQ